MKSARTEMMLPPSIEECVKAAVERGMPEAEGRKFFYHYDSNGWKVGKVPMKSFAGAMGGWYERWAENGGAAGVHRPPVGNGTSTAGGLSGADKMIKQDEYRRVIERMKVIANSYDSHNEMRPADRAENIKLRKRRDELRKELGVMI